MKFRKKPVVIEAVQFNGPQRHYVASWCGAVLCDEAGRPPKLHIQTLEGTMTADEGDWIIKGVQGEFYPCKPDIFDATYEPVTP